MSSRALRRLQGDDLSLKSEDVGSSGDEMVVQSAVSRKKKQAKVANLFELLNDDECGDGDGLVLSDKDRSEPEGVETVQVKSKKKKKKKKKTKEKVEVNNTQNNRDGEDEIDASIREVNAMLNNQNIGETAVVNDSTRSMFKNLLTVEHRNLNPENEMRKIFGSRVMREEGGLSNRHRAHTRRRQKSSWMVQPKDTWPPFGKTGLSMSLKDTKDGCQYFLFEHSHQYQQVQFQFYDAVESLNPQNIGGIIQLQPFHVDALMQLGEVFRMSEDMNMASEMTERALYAMEMASHPLFNIATGTCRLEYKYRENRCMHLSLFKHIVSLGNRGCNRTALEFCKLLLSLGPDADPLCAILLIDFYALRSGQYEYLIRLFDEWEAHKNLSQLPNFAFSIPLAMFHQNMEETEKADNMLQDSLLMFPGMLVPLLDKCSVKADESVSHKYFQTADYRTYRLRSACTYVQSDLSPHLLFGLFKYWSNLKDAADDNINEPDALKQLIALYVGRCYMCWKVPEVMEWLERNVKLVIERVEKKDPCIETYKTRRKSRYVGTPRNIYRHILVSDIPSATATIPQDIASTVMSYDPLPPSDSVEGYKRPSRPSRAQTEQSAITTFLRSLLPNYNPNEPAPEGAAAGPESLRLREGAGALMDAMRDMLNNIRMVEHPIENNEEGEEDEEHILEWD